MAIAVAFTVMGAFFMAGLYVAGALGVVSLVLMYFFSDAPLWNIMANRAWTTYNEFILLSIPLFVLMGELVLRSGIAERMYTALNRWVAPIPGGLLHTNIASCAIFAACSGHSVATAATVSRVALPSFRARGYNERLVLGSLAAGGTLGILIPPSIMLVLYGLSTGTSIGRLFLAGFIPGFMLALVFMLMIGVMAKIWPSIAPRESTGGLFDLRGWWDRIAGTVALLPIFALIFAVLGTIYLGIATPSEAAAAGVTGAFVLAVASNSMPALLPFLLKAANWSGVAMLLPGAARARLQEMQRARPLAPNAYATVVRANLKMVTDAALSTMRTTGMIMFILFAAFTMQFAFAYLRISIEMANWVSGFELSPVQLVLILVVFYLILGTFMESFAMMLTTLPILFPTLVASGVDLLWFGIIMIILLEAAQISPPEGLTLYVLQSARQDVSAELGAAEGVPERVGTITDIWIGIMPFMLCMAIVIGLIIAFPEIATWLPDQVKGPRL
jgi:tripartite ATP-independent transporter DctM subunit